MKNSARCRVNDSIEIEKQEAEILQLGAGFGTVEAEHWEVTEQGIHVEGTVWVSILYLTSSDAAPVGAAEGLVPFQYDVEIPEMKSFYQIELQTGLAHLSFLMKSGTELEVQAVVDIETLITKEKQSELITGTEDREYDINWLNHIPGIAGIILAIGMGVDANVITAERIKEELKNGKSLDGALKRGFARGLTPIIDGNVTIVIVAIVLMGAFGPSDGLFAKALHFVFFAFGPSTAGTIYAFGYTLLTGVLLNFVFGVFATRVMIRGAAAIKALRNPWLYGAAKPGQEKAEKKPVNFVALRKKFLTFSACLMAVILLCAAVFGVHLDTEFTGGAMITLSYEGSFDQAAVQKTAIAALENTGLTLQTGENVATGDQTLKISMPGTETVTTEQVENLLDSLNENYPDNQFAQLSLSNVSAAMGTKFLQKSLVAVVFSLLLILLYIGFRFKKIGGLTGGLMAVLALFNDLMVVFGTFVLLRTALDGNFLAAMLTILGYSINDTVVVYDRIRENRALMGKKGSFEELGNQSVNQSARRTLITTITTVMALGVMCIVAKLYGLDSIFTFAFPLMMGMISGVYTSLCVSTSAWVLWSERSKKKN